MKSATLFFAVLGWGLSSFASDLADYKNVFKTELGSADLSASHREVTIPSDWLAKSKTLKFKFKVDFWGEVEVAKTSAPERAHITSIPRTEEEMDVTIATTKENVRHFKVVVTKYVLVREGSNGLVRKDVTPKFKGHTVSFDISDKGKLSQLQGVDELIDDIKAKPDGGELADLVKAGFQPSALEQWAHLDHDRALYDKTLKPLESVDGGFEIGKTKYESKYTFAGWSGQEMAVIEQEGSFRDSTTTTDVPFQARLFFDAKKNRVSKTVKVSFISTASKTTAAKDDQKIEMQVKQRLFTKIEITVL